MSILKDLTSVARLSSEVRHLSKFVTEMLDVKKKLTLATQEIYYERKAKQELIAAIKKHQAEMKEEDYPRNFQCDTKLWELVKKYE